MENLEPLHAAAAAVLNGTTAMQNSLGVPGAEVCAPRPMCWRHGLQCGSVGGVV